MSKKYRIDTDQGSFIVETDEPGTDNAAILAQQAAKYPTAAEQGGKPGAIATPLDYQGPMGFLAHLGHAMTDTAPGAMTGMNTPEVALLAAATPGGKWEGLGSALANSPAANLAAAIKERIFPSSKHAGQAFDVLKEAAANEAPDLSKAFKAVLRGKELTASGHGPISEGMKTLYEALQPAQFDAMGTPLTVDPAQIKYPQSFDMASAAKKLAYEETNRMTGMMQHQVTEFARALQEANRNVAIKLGMGDLFDRAMAEYSRAEILRDATGIAKRYLAKAALAAALGSAGAAGGYATYEALKGR